MGKPGRAEPANRERESAPTGRPLSSVPIWLLHPFFRVVLFVLVALLLLLLVSVVTPETPGGLPEGARSPLWYALAIPALLLESWAFVWAFHGKSYRAFGLWFYPGWGRELATGVIIGAGLLSIVVGVLVMVRGVAYRGFAGGERLFLGVLGIGGWMVLAAALEEIVFRGYLFQRLLDWVGPIAAVTVLSALFAGAHLANPSPTALSTVNTFLSGVLLSLAYVRTRALWLPIGLHWGWNFCMGTIFCLPVSGLHLGPAVLRVEPVGSRWLTGGAYGPEGSVVLSVACLGVIVWLSRTRRVSTSPAMEEALK